MFKNFNKYLNVILICALISTYIFTWMAPKIISILFTPPVSFGVNCEPAAVWSMQKLMASQIFGLVVGVMVSFFIIRFLKRREEKQIVK